MGGAILVRDVAVTKHGRRVLTAVTLFVVAASIVAAVYMVLFGKLFPYSPTAIGFNGHEYSHVVVYQQEGEPSEDLAWVNDLIPGIEAFHHLKFTAKPAIYFFNNSDTYAARSVSGARLCSFFNGNVVVSPWARTEDAAGEISLKIYLTHELSHSLLYQNMGFAEVLSYPRWLLEGIAMYSADQMGTSFYPDREQTFAMIRKGNWMPPADFGTRHEDDVKLAVKYPQAFAYSEFGFIVDDLIGHYGMDVFLQYMKVLLEETDHDKVFHDAFGMSFDDYLADLRARIAE